MSHQPIQNAWRRAPSRIAIHFWFKCFGTLGFIALFFAAYVYLLRHPVYAVTVIPAIWLDHLIAVQPLFLPFYLSLWLYVSLPPMLMVSRQAIIEYGIWMGGLCLAALAIFYFQPTTVGPTGIDWSLYPGMAILRGMDAAGNACPSLHVATAVFSCLWLCQYLPALGFGRLTRWLAVAWCVAIVYSTMATKQHMALDVAAGIILSLIVFAAFALSRRREY
ncbi:MAG: phosphatase PAP2 family protein [Desulfobulbus sp.]|nr:phosphatase PAP2 family protein [Desulfobulbus sp.]